MKSKFIRFNIMSLVVLLITVFSIPTIAEPKLYLDNDTDKPVECKVIARPYWNAPQEKSIATGTAEKGVTRLVAPLSWVDAWGDEQAIRRVECGDEKTRLCCSSNKCYKAGSDCTYIDKKGEQKQIGPKSTVTVIYEYKGPGLLTGTVG